jgi:isoleucyl-tRNA synthetase
MENKEETTAGNKDASRKSVVARREEDTLVFWRERDIFKKSLEKDAPKGNYVF